MNITNNGVFFRDYVTASSGSHISTFTDKDGARLCIDTTTLIHMYELVKFDLERSNEWNSVLQRMERMERI